jgi:hypothetical protein
LRKRDKRPLPRLHALPQVLIDNPQGRHLLDYPTESGLSRDTRLPVSGSFT